MERKYHPYTDWEDYKNGQYKRSVDNERELILKAKALLKDKQAFETACKNVMKEWPISCEQNLTNLSINRIAWMGQAACCLRYGCPDYITKLAWGLLTQKSMDEANKIAGQIISIWECNYNNEYRLF